MRHKITRERIADIGFNHVDAYALEPGVRNIFMRNKQAIELKLDGYTGPQILKLTGMPECELSRYFKRYTTIDEQGIFWGEAALIPFSRVVPYTRKTPPEKKHSEAQGGLAGILTYTLAKYPDIASRFEEEVFRKDWHSGHGSRFEKKHLCAVFYDICRSSGVTEEEWPLNQPRGARKTIGTYIDNILKNDFARAALVTGGRVALTHSKVGTGHVPFIEDFDVYDLIEIDSYHADAFFVLNVSGDKRTKTKNVLSRIWLIAAVCRRSNAILAIKFVFSSEIRSQDLVDLICDAYTGSWEPRKSLTIPELRYTATAGMPSYSVPGLRHHTWGAVCLDNAMQHHADKVYDLALHGLGFAINFGPLGQPARRSKIEALFKRITHRVMQQLPSTTGSSPERGRAEAPEAAAVYYQIDVDDALEVMDVYTANYNGTPQGGLNKVNSPLDVMHGYASDKLMLLPLTSEIYLNSIALGSLSRHARVTGSVKKGVRPRIKLDQAIYTSPELANSPHLIGQQLLVRITPHDYRYVEAYLSDGIYFGQLRVEAAWRNVPHSVTTRQLVNRAYAKREFDIMEGEHPVLAWQKHLRTNANARNNLELKRLQEEIYKAPQLPTVERPESETLEPTSVVTERWKTLEILK
jgi:hypothetical protein